MGRKDQGLAPGGRGEGIGRVVHHDQGEREICGALCGGKAKSLCSYHSL
jgi:hypothetical protein